eukprot:IDg21963t1
MEPMTRFFVICQAQQGRKMSILPTRCWGTEMIDAAIEEHPSGVRPSASLTKSAFYKVWEIHYSVLRIFTGGSDYCDTCVTLRNQLNLARDDGAEELRFMLNSHKREANNEFQFYNKCSVKHVTALTAA